MQVRVGERGQGRMMMGRRWLSILLRRHLGYLDVTSNFENVSTNTRSEIKGGVKERSDVDWKGRPSFASLLQVKRLGVQRRRRRQSRSGRSTSSRTVGSELGRSSSLSRISTARWIDDREQKKGTASSYSVVNDQPLNSVPRLDMLTRSTARLSLSSSHLDDDPLTSLPIPATLCDTIHSVYR